MFVFLLVAPISAFGQAAHDKYREAKAAEFRSDNAKNPNERGAYISVAFTAISEAADSDGRYVDSFATITRKYFARQSSRGVDRYWYAIDEIVKVGEKRSGHPAFKRVATEIINGYKQILSERSFVPGKPINQSRRDRSHCSVPYSAEHIYKMSRLVYPANSPQVMSWGRYAADAYMTNLRGCGGEGTDTEGDPVKAFPLYSAIHHIPGLHKTGKLLGDGWMEIYIFGGYDLEGNGSQYNPSHRPSYDRAMQFYRAGGVTRNDIRSTILRCLRRAEEWKNQRAIDVAQKALAESF